VSALCTRKGLQSHDLIPKLSIPDFDTIFIIYIFFVVVVCKNRACILFRGL
jgi:hypothetical protein